MKTASLMLSALAVLTSPLAACAQTPAGEPPAAAGGYYQFQRVVYQNSGGLPDDRAYFLRVLRNIGAHISATEGNVEISLVSFSGGVKVFRDAKTDPELAKAIDAALAKKVRFLVCANTMRAMNVTPADLHGVTEADVVPSGVAEIARLQGKGYAYIHP